MSLVSLNSEGHPEIWRTAFGLAGAIGALELALSLVYIGAEPRRAKRIQWLLTVTLPLYLAIVAIAMFLLPALVVMTVAAAAVFAPDAGASAGIPTRPWTGGTDWKAGRR